MKRIITITLLTLLIQTPSLFAQDATFMIGEKAYPATRSFHFGCIPHFKEMMLAKDGDKALVVFKDMCRVSGTVLFYLKNNTIIKLYDKSRYDYYNNKYSVVYVLTKEEVEKVIEHGLASIRINSCVYKDGSKGDPIVIQEPCSISLEFGSHSTDVSGYLKKLFEK